MPQVIAVFSKAISPVTSSTRARGDGASTAVQLARSAPRMSRYPAPLTSGSPNRALRADIIRRAFTLAGVSEGSCWIIRAAVAATMGEAMLVPDISKYSTTSGCSGSAATRRSGRSRSRCEPGGARGHDAVAGRHQVGLGDEVEGRRPARGVGRDLVVFDVRSARVVRRADGDHLGRVARAGDGDVAVTAAVARGADHHDAGVPQLLDRLHQGIDAGGLVHRVPQGDVDHADAVLVLVIEDPLQPGQHIGSHPAADAVQDAHRDQARFRRDTRHAAAGVAAAADHDAGHVGAMAVGIDAVLGRRRRAGWNGRPRPRRRSGSGCRGAGRPPSRRRRW